MPEISIVVNLDTRNENSNAERMFSGTVNDDYLTDGIFNKIAFFKNFSKEVIVYIDRHNEVPQQALEYLHNLCDTVIVRRHTDEVSFNCYNYLRALQMASGDIVCHIDQDTAMFNHSDYDKELVLHLDNHKFVSYPSHWSPKPVIDESFGNRTWASTRFFLCKRETLRFDELRAAVAEPETAYQKYGDSPRRCNWLEHFLTLTNGDDCYYPPIEPQKGLIFSWGSYEKYTLRRLNELPYEQIVEFVNSKGGIQYPNDIFC